MDLSINSSILHAITTCCDFIVAVTITECWKVIALYYINKLVLHGKLKTSAKCNLQSSLENMLLKLHIEECLNMKHCSHAKNFESKRIENWGLSIKQKLLPAIYNHLLWFYYCTYYRGMSAGDCSLCHFDFLECISTKYLSWKYSGYYCLGWNLWLVSSLENMLVNV